MKGSHLLLSEKQRDGQMEGAAVGSYDAWSPRWGQDGSLHASFILSFTARTFAFTERLVCQVPFQEPVTKPEQSQGTNAPGSLQPSVGRGEEG